MVDVSGSGRWVGCHTTSGIQMAAGFGFSRQHNVFNILNVPDDQCTLYHTLGFGELGGFGGAAPKITGVWGCNPQERTERWAFAKK